MSAFHSFTKIFTMPQITMPQITMPQIIQPGQLFCLTVAAVTCSLFINTSSWADVVLTFEQDGATNGQAVNQNYGDNVIASPDSNGHQYDIIVGNGFGLTPNVQASYSGDNSPAIWITGYGDLTTVLYGSGSSTLVRITLEADPGFEVGLFGFDMASFFSSGSTIPGLQVLDGDDNVLWSQGSTLILGGGAHSDFDFAGGLFASTLKLEIDVTGVGNNAGVDNVHFAQRSPAIPEPTMVGLVPAMVLAIAGRRRR